MSPITPLQAAVVTNDMATVEGILEEMEASMPVSSPSARQKRRSPPRLRPRHQADDGKVAPWSLAPPRDSGTLFLIEKSRLVMAAQQPAGAPAHMLDGWRRPAWARPERPSSAPTTRVSSAARKLSAARGAPGPEPPDSLYSTEKAAAEWLSNRGGGGCWSKAPRMSGTLALIEKSALDLAARAPPPKTTWSPPSWPLPAWASGRSTFDDRARPRKSPAAQLVSEYATATLRPSLWPPLDASYLQYEDVRELLGLLTDATQKGLRASGRALPGTVAHVDASAATAADAPAAPASAASPARPPGSSTPAATAIAAATATAGAGAIGGEVASATASGVDEAHGPCWGFQTLAMHLNSNRLADISALPSVLATLLWDGGRSLLTLDLSANRIVHIPAELGVLASLEVLRLHNNALAHMTELDHLRPLRSLARLTLMHNPLVMQRLTTLARLELKHSAPLADQKLHGVKFDPMAYRLRVLGRLPQLRQLDLMPVTGKERSRALQHAAHPARRPDGVLRSRPHPQDLESLAKLHAKANGKGEPE